MLPDLNLLRVLDVMLEERSVTRAGARLGLSQSAVSHALNRLRHQLNDELFVRGPSGMQPTARALDLAAGVHAAMSQLQATLAPADFDPATTTRRFTVMVGAYAASVLAPPLMQRLAEVAPVAELSFSDHPTEVVDLLDARQADFTVASVVSAPSRFAYERLIAEELTWVVSIDSPLAGRPADLGALAETPQIVVARRPAGLMDERANRRGVVLRASWEDGGAFDAALAAAGLTRRVAVTMPDTNSALAVARRSHLATLAPRRLALAWAQAGGLALIEPPYPSPPVEIGLMYLKERLQEPPIAWMRGLIREVAQDL
ncbi:MAG: LysR family transcriptional regulator [Caulobacterales bacterium]|nr:LysR family transcriptional regulator [Caulobacterales bacterium]